MFLNFVCRSFLEDRDRDRQFVLFVAEGRGIGPELVVELVLEVSVFLGVSAEGLREWDGGGSRSGASGAGRAAGASRSRAAARARLLWAPVSCPRIGLSLAGPVPAGSLSGPTYYKGASRWCPRLNGRGVLLHWRVGFLADLSGELNKDVLLFSACFGASRHFGASLSRHFEASLVVGGNAKIDGGFVFW